MRKDEALKVSSSVVRSLRVSLFLRDMTGTAIARLTGYARPTVSQMLRNDDMRLSQFIAIADAGGIDPAEAIVQAMKKPAAATAGVSQTRKD
ncbi:hypothetical protein PSRA_0834 [Pseudoscardovia radai]|uniref:HTH cro/C1-type domain-containing protein n=1 Tax=Pseudoscardovia radai TaxID=987066 RepID=A0A261EY23_9BIFI|nr:helix-turn-helix domain-containing protein [Pseudoscardovia radai]OZG51754.1 hypothetical protein PSRA_0834 [Pseudoscardovia radai]